MPTTSLARGAIFDLDGVLVDTAGHHYAAWREEAERLGLDLTLEQNERLKGVGRMDALAIVLDLAGVSLDAASAAAVAARKNARYLELIGALTPADVLPGARQLLTRLHELGVPVALGSASKNARHILDLIGLTDLLDVIVDGHVVERAKPDPEVFLVAAALLGLPPSDCVVFEDAVAGLEAADAGGLRAVAVGDATVLTGPAPVVRDLSEVDAEALFVTGTMTAAAADVELAGAPFHLDDTARSWVATTRAGLSLEQKVGQLFCLIDLPATTQNVDAAFAVVEPGGYMRRPAPSDQIAELTTYMQSKARVPLLIAANLESGADMIGTDLTSFGSPLQTAATGDVTNAYRLGLVCGTEARAVGCTWGFAPIVDVQVTPANPMILTRGFGSEVSTVASYSAAFVRGMQSAGVAASVKHWPGDGVDDRDQHLVTGVNTLSVEDWEATFGQVYRTVVDAGAMTVMAAHIAMPAWSRALRPGIADEDILPASLAPELTTDLLRGRLGFRGLVVTDATLMAGMQVPMARRDMVPAAIAAGCDMFLFTLDYAEDVAFMLDGVRCGVISAARLDEAVTRVLALKAALGLHRASAQDLVPDPTCAGVDREQHRRWARASADAAITLVKDKDPRALPMDPSRHRRVLVYSLRGPDATTAPAERFVEAMTVEGFDVHLMGASGDTGPREPAFGRMGAVVGRELLDNFDAVVYLLDVWPVSNEPTPRLHWSMMGANVPKYTIEVPTVVVSLGSPYHLQDVPRVKTFINAYGHNEATVLAVVDKLVGRSPFTGHSPVDPFCGYWDARL